MFPVYDGKRLPRIARSKCFFSRIDEFPVNYFGNWFNIIHTSRNNQIHY